MVHCNFTEFRTTGVLSLPKNAAVVDCVKIGSDLKVEEWQREFVRRSPAGVPTNCLELFKEILKLLVVGVLYIPSGIFERLVRFKDYSRLTITVSGRGVSSGNDFERIFGDYCAIDGTLKIRLPHGNFFPTWCSGGILSITSLFSFADILLAAKIVYVTRRNGHTVRKKNEDLFYAVGFLKFVAFHLHLERVFKNLLSKNLAVINFSFEGIFWERLMLAAATDAGHRLEGFQRGIFLPQALRYFSKYRPSKIFVSGSKLAAYVRDTVHCETSVLGVIPLEPVALVEKTSRSERNAVYMSQGARDRDLFWIDKIDPIFRDRGLTTYFKPHPLIDYGSLQLRDQQITNLSLAELFSQDILFVGFFSFSMVEARISGAEVISLGNLFGCNNNRDNNWMPFFHNPTTIDELRGILSILVNGKERLELPPIREWYACRSS